jgi:hypothetical protein
MNAAVPNPVHVRAPIVPANLSLVAALIVVVAAIRRVGPDRQGTLRHARADSQRVAEKRGRVLRQINAATN